MPTDDIIGRTRLLDNEIKVKSPFFCLLCFLIMFLWFLQQGLHYSFLFIKSFIIAGFIQVYEAKIAETEAG